MTERDARSKLSRAMARLVDEKGMLTGITVCWGDARGYQTARHGLAREVVKRGEGFESAPRPIDEKTIYDIASLTKLFTLVAALQLIEQGRMAFEDSVARIDPRFKALEYCSLLELLCYEAVLKTPERVDAQPDLPSALAQVFATYRAPETPGTKLYSDMNALVLKYLVETASGLPFHQYLKAHVFDPLGMRETWMKVPDDLMGQVMDYNYEHRVIGARHVLLEGNSPGLPHDPKARLLGNGGQDLAGHAGLFSTEDDMSRFAMGLLSGAVLSKDMLNQIGVNRTGINEAGRPYRQYMGLICFSKSSVRRLSEVPPWMGERAFALSGYTGNHIAIDPERGVFDLFLGNRCHNRLSVVEPQEKAEQLGLCEDGSGTVIWPDGRQVKSSFRYVYQKDDLLHAPVWDCLKAEGKIRREEG